MEIDYEDLGFAQEGMLRNGVLQKDAMREIIPLLDIGKPLAECRDWYLRELGFTPSQVGLMQKELVDNLALCLTYEHDRVPDILRFLEENESEVFPEGLASYEFHVRVETYRDAAGTGRPEAFSVVGGKEVVRDLPAMDKYLKTLWDEDISGIIAYQQYCVVEEISRLGYITKPNLLFQLMAYSGEKAALMRKAITGSEMICPMEAAMRMTQIMVVAFPILKGKHHLVGSVTNGDVLLKDHHLKELEGAADFLGQWGSTHLGYLIKGLLEQEQQSSMLDSEPSHCSYTRDVFEFFRKHIPDLHRHLGYLLCNEDLGRVASLDYTESDFCLGLMKAVAKRGRENQNEEGGFIAKMGRGNYHRYIEIIKLWGKEHYTKLPENLSPQELLLAYQLLQYKPLLHRLKGAQQERAFSTDLGL